MHGRSLLLTGLIALLIPTAAGAATLPARTALGPEQGVTASASGRTLTIGFTGAAAAWGRAHAGRKVVVECHQAPPSGLLFVKDPGGLTDPLHLSTGTARLGADGAAVRVGLDGPARDACTVDGAPDWAAPPSTQVAYAAVTPAGAASIDETARATRMADVLHAARPHGAYRPAADVVALGGGEVVALEDPNGTPPAGKIGYWSKGRAVSLITASSAGRRLAIQDLGGGMLRTNVLEDLTGWLPVGGFKAAPDSGADLADDGDDQGGEGDDGSADNPDIHAHRSGDRVVFRFTGKAAKAYRRHAGQRVRVVCLKAPPRALLGEATPVDAHPASTVVRVPRRGGVITGDAPAGHRDLCGIVTRTGGDLATGVLTRDGWRYLLDLIAPLALAFADGSPTELAEPGATRYPGVATIIASHGDLVGLATPGAPVKGDRIGIWTDADQQALIAFGAGFGLRYVLADEGHGMMRTNLYTGFLGALTAAIERRT
jgi:hypothetical protein